MTDSISYCMREIEEAQYSQRCSRCSSLRAQITRMNRENDELADEVRKKDNRIKYWKRRARRAEGAE